MSENKNVTLENNSCYEVLRHVVISLFLVAFLCGGELFFFFLTYWSFLPSQLRDSMYACTHRSQFHLHDWYQDYSNYSS